MSLSRKERVMSRESFSIEELMRYLREATVTELHARFWTLIRGSEVLLTPYGVVLAHSHHIEEGSWFLLLFSGEKFGRHLVVGGSTAGIYGVDNSADVSELLKVFEYLIYSVKSNHFYYVSKSRCTFSTSIKH